MPGHGLGGGHRHPVQGVPERGPQRVGLGDVPDGCGGAVGVDVHEVGRGQPPGAQRRTHGPGGAGAAGLGGGHVVGVCAGPGPGQGGVHPRAAGCGVLGGLQDEGAGALPEDEPVASLVERPGCRLRGVVTPGQGLHLGESGERQRVDRRLRPAGDGHVRPAGPDHVQGVADGLRARRARADRGVHPGPGGEGQPHGRGRTVGHEHRHHVWGDPARAPLAQYVVLVEQGQHPADAGADHRGEPFGVDLGRPGVGPRLPGGHQSQLLHAVESACLQPLQRGFHRDGRGDVNRKLLDPLVGQPTHTGTAREQTLPRGGDVAAERGGCPEAGDDDLPGGGGHAATPARWM